MSRASKRRDPLEIPPTLFARERPDPPWIPQQIDILRFAENAARAVAAGEETASLAVEAAAGASKTTITVAALKRIARIAPGLRILLLAYNREIRHVLARLAPPGVDVFTLHSFGLLTVKASWGSGIHPGARHDARLLKSHVPAKAPRKVKVVAKRLLTLARANLGVGAQSVLEIIKSGHESLRLPWEKINADSRTRWGDQDLARWVSACLTEVREPPTDGEVSFDDLCYLPVALGMPFDSYDIVAVDEVQDLSRAMRAMVRRALRPGGFLLAVGDPNQGIYQFRGAGERSMQDLVAETKAVRLPLPVSFRCSKAVVAYAQKLVPSIEPMKGAREGEVTEISSSSLIEALKKEGQDLLVIARTNAVLSSLCLALWRAGIPAKIRGKSLASDLSGMILQAERTVGGGDDDGSMSIRTFLTWLDDYVGAEIDQLDDDEEDPASSLVDRAMTLRALCEGLRTIRELRVRLARLFDETAKAVCLSTAHQAKGDEAETVYLLVDSFLPIKDGQARNLLYVAITRAKERLFVVSGHDF